MAPAPTTPATRAWLATLEVEAHALDGNPALALHALDRAEAALNRTSDAPQRPRVGFFDQTYLLGERGVALRRLGRPDEAYAALTSALHDLPISQVKTRPRLLTALATAHVQRGDIDEACRLAGEALTLATKQEVTPNLRDVVPVRRTPQPLADNSARPGAG